MIKVNVLGTEYNIYESNADIDEKMEDRDGYCDTSIKVCIVDEMKATVINQKANIEDYKKSVIRHELIHAFLYESGLDVCSYFAKDETLVDWIAIQFPKMLKAFKEANAL